MELNRRKFLTRAGVTAAGAALSGTLGGSARASTSAAGQDTRAIGQDGGPAAAAPSSAATRAGERTVGFDRYSLLIDGVRTPVWSGEFHPMRLPSPALWPDVLQKMKAHGFNAVSMYFSWNFHSPAPGSYDFTGVRDLDRAMAAAADAGLYVIARPGPYINAEVDCGGFPGWLTTLEGRARTNAPDYLAAVDEWQHEVNTIIAGRQHLTGGGSVILYQIENEYAAHTADDTGRGYLANLYAQARADGIVVPIFHNDKGRNGFWTPGAFPGSAEDGGYLYAFDGYPDPGGTPPDWGYFGTGGPKGGATASPDTPGFTAEFGGGWFDPWGGQANHHGGYPGIREERSPRYERAFYLTNLANGLKLHNVYMTFGGTSWGWLPAPVVYTSYDYGAAVTESRQLTAKLSAMKQLGLFAQSVPDLGKLDRAADVAASDARVKVYHLTNPDTQAHVYVLRAAKGAAVTFTLPVGDAANQRTVPASGTLKLASADATALLAGAVLGTQHLVYSTSQVMWHARMGERDVLVLTGRDGDDSETVLALEQAPAATAPGVHWDAAAGEVRINQTLPTTPAPVEVPVAAGDRAALLLLAGDTAAAVLWPRETEAGGVVVHGPHLVRDAQVTDDRLELVGDTTADTVLTVWAPAHIDELTWNGHAVPATRTPSGALVSRTRLHGPTAVALPELTGWRCAAENPESDPAFDDSGWRAADATSSHSTTPVPAGQPVLFADDYGFHYGDVWYRGRFSGDPGAAVGLAYQTGTAGALLAWLDGTPLGAHRMPVPTADEDTKGTWAATAELTVPDAARTGGAHVLAVLVRRMAHEEDGGANDAYKSARGLTGVTLASGAPLAWRVQGALGGQKPPDPTRGPLNNGGLYGEREGWHLPATPKGGTWNEVGLPHRTTRQGVTWYRTSVTLDVPPDLDASLGITFDDPTFMAAGAAPYRVLLFCNGWNMGQYANDQGPQRTFVLPSGVLDPRGHNTLALAVLATGESPAGLPHVTLTDLGTVRGGVPLD